MRIFGIVCEFNPFHNGHAYLINKCKENPDSAVICVMSGNIVQRGDFAIIDRATRTKIALDNGADLVIELPMPFSCSSAEKFSSAAIFLLENIGLVEEIAFGVETHNTELLEKIARLNMEPKTYQEIREEMSNGSSFPVSFTKIIEKKLNMDLSEFLIRGNNILAIEYLTALYKLNSKMRPFYVNRIGDGHDQKGDSEITSASNIRRMLYCGDEAAFHYMPKEFKNLYDETICKGQAPVRLETAERAIMSLLRSFDKERFFKTPDVVEGLENRIYSAVNEATSIEEIIDKICTKRYTRARIRRILINSCIGVNKEDLGKRPMYIKVLGHNEKGRQILRMARKSSELPIVTRTSHVANLSSYAKRIYEINSCGDDLYNLAKPKIYPCGNYYKENIIVN